MWHLKVVQLAVDRKVAPTGGSRKLNAHLFQRCAHPIRAKVRVFRELFDFLNRRNIGLSELLSRMRFVGESCKLFLCKSSENDMHCFSAHVQVACYRCDVPSVSMQPNDCSSESVSAQDAVVLANVAPTSMMRKVCVNLAVLPSIALAPQ